MPKPTRLLPRYADARAEFLAACERVGAPVVTSEREQRGPEGETLAVDWTQLGDPQAPAAVLVVSGTHGAEGIAGSALQRLWLDECEPAVPDGVCVILVHAVNPYGFAWMRRVDESNVDCNRNYVDWQRPLPEDLGYAEWAEWLVPRDWSEANQQRTTEALLERAQTIGFDAFQQIVTGGQYTHPEGIFFGGQAPSTTHEWVRAFCEQRLAPLERLAVIDLHTGLGPWGHGELISSTTAAHPSHVRAASWYGQVCSQVDGDSVSQDLRGEWLLRIPEWLPETAVTPVALEFGTVDVIRVLQALRADAWLHAYGDPAGREARAIKDELRNVFCDPDPKWLAKLWARFSEVFGAALSGVRARERA